MPPDPKATCERCRAEVSPNALFCPMCGQPRRAAEDDPLLGKVIADRYLLRQRLGQGGSGTIYLAEHITVKRKVAVKVLHHELSQDDLAIERFRREATTVAEIDNEHIVEVLDFGRLDDGRLFLAMELLDGETLHAAIRRQGKLSVEQALDVLVQVGEALMEAHAMGYVHRDLRPANIFLARRRGRQGFVKILDFGLAKLVEREGEAATTSLGMTFGDPCYMSPEQARGEGVDRRADIYALGCMAFEMLIGRPPFVGKKVFEVLNQHLEDPPPRPSQLRRDLAPWLDALILRALAKRAEDRFVTVYRLIEAVREGQSTGQTMSDEAALSMPPVEPEPPAPRRRDADLLAPPAMAPAVRSAPPVRSAPAVRSSPPVEALISTPPVASNPSASRRVLIPPQGEGPSSSWFDRGDDLEAASSAVYEPPRSRRGLWIAAGVLAAGGVLIALFAMLSSGGRPVVAPAAESTPDARIVVEIAAEPPAPPPPEPVAVQQPPDATPVAAIDAAPPPPDARPPAPSKPAATRTKPKPPVKKPTASKPKPARDAPPVFDFRPKPPSPEPAAGDDGPEAEAEAEDDTPENGQAAFYVKLGERSLREGNADGATENFNKARAFDPRNADAIAGLGMVALRQGRANDAIVHLEAAARLRSGSARIQTLLGQAYLAAGKRDEAVAAFKKALKINPDYAAAVEGYRRASGE